MLRIRFELVMRTLGLFLFVVLSGCATTAREDGAPRVYLLPLGDFSPDSAENLGKYVHQKSGVTTTVLPQQALPRRVVDYQRKQLVAEELTALVAEQYGSLLRKPKRAIIVLTEDDTYIQKSKSRFSLASQSAPGIVIISSWRMDPANLGQPKDEKRTQERLEKMLARNVGLTVSQRSENNDPGSLFYKNVISVEDVDAIERDF